jgi:cell shape-determining protein MreC
MRRIRFNQVFSLAFLICVISAFVLPERSDQSWNNAEIIFAPVAAPARRVAAWLGGTFRPQTQIDRRNDADIRRENQELKAELAQLQSQLQAVAKMAAERRQLGPLLNDCVAAPVIGADSGDRQALNVRQSEPAELQAGQAVVCPFGMVGRIVSASPAGAKVRLITDKSARPISVSFGRLLRQSDGQYLFQRLQTEKTLVYGNGENQLIARQGLTIVQVKSSDLRVGDWAVLDDADFPLVLEGLRVGQITDIRASLTAPLYADVFLQPVANLAELQQVLVVIKR